ncbi:hypothetical protein MSAN_00148200 [Mycena sanguinolenta]|uniref:Uncharacterized protein n=1 Tax=Mycena sanguinolenta TaxID=230812 RepID=A0A8H6ZGV2_9AGAR|nr:hypothetical protein MSAN_00148200 [Mycena sanguinolenta]
MGTGNTESGSLETVERARKSTVGKQLADVLGLPFISLDTLFWNPGWKQSTNEELQARVEQRLADCPNGWVVDGNYTRRISTIIDDNSTDVIWLDPPLALTLPRVIWRTFLRMLRLKAPCSPGCNERLSEVLFSKESIVWWCITHDTLVRERETARMARIGLGIGSDVEGQKMRRIGGWGKELRVWFDDGISFMKFLKFLLVWIERRLSWTTLRWRLHGSLMTFRPLSSSGVSLWDCPLELSNGTKVGLDVNWYLEFWSLTHVKYHGFVFFCNIFAYLPGARIIA